VFVAELRQEVCLQAQEREGPGGEGLTVLALDAVRDIARRCAVQPREVEICALQEEVIPLRYQRSIGSIGTDGQLTLLQSTVAVVGAGGLGGVVCEILARTGVGELVIIDGDEYDESNLNRQIHSTEQNLKQKKVDSSKERAAQINSSVSVRARDTMLSECNAECLLDGVDVVVDCLDSIPDRFLVERACARQRVPMVHGAVAGMMGQILTIYPGDVGLRALYGEEGNRRHGVEISFGNLGTVVTTVAALQSQEVVKIITGVGAAVRNRVLFLDLVSGDVHGVDVGN